MCMDMGLALPNVIANDRGDNDGSIYDGQGNESGQCIREKLINNYQ